MKGGSDADVDCRVREAKGAFGILSPIWRNIVVLSQTSLKYEYLKAISYQFYCMVQTLGKSPNQVFVNRCLRRIFSLLLAQYYI